jgi:hypothetical protein
MIMPGIDFDVVRREISMQQVLDAIGFIVITRSGDQLRGPCPVHGSPSKVSRVFSVNLGEQRYYCHKYKSHGNQLELRAPRALWRHFTIPPSICVTHWDKTCHGFGDGKPS